MRKYQDLLIWNKAIEITKSVYKITELLPDQEKYGIISQVRRAAISICSNIAEGCSRSSRLEFKRFLEIALGSAFELECKFIIIKELDLVSLNDLEQIFISITEEQKMINSYIQKLKAKS